MIITLLKVLHTLKKNLVHPHELAEQACQVELERLREVRFRFDFEGTKVVAQS
jgi:galactokinase/mevalonate kinase-like predicted kinase